MLYHAGRQPFDPRSCFLRTESVRARTPTAERGAGEAYPWLRGTLSDLTKPTKSFWYAKRSLAHERQKSFFRWSLSGLL